MDRNETKQILMRMEMSFPNFTVKDADRSLMIDTWCEMLSEYAYKDVLMALKTYITTNTSGFAPTIGQIIESMHLVDRQTELNELQAWQMVSKALRDSTYHADEQFGKLPKLVQQCVGSASQLRNWAQTDIESVENVIQSNFCRTYRTMVNRERTYNSLSSDVKQVIDSTSRLMIGGENNT